MELNIYECFVISIQDIPSLEVCSKTVVYVALTRV